MTDLDTTTFNTPRESLDDSRHQDADELIADQVHALGKEQRRL